jgi:hypothetical protein
MQTNNSSDIMETEKSIDVNVKKEELLKELKKICDHSFVKLDFEDKSQIDIYGNGTVNRENMKQKFVFQNGMALQFFEIKELLINYQLI